MKTNAAEVLLLQEQDLAVVRGIAETIALSRVRGEIIKTPGRGRGESRKPAQKLDGLAFLYHQGAIGQAQYHAGQCWQDYYITIHRSGVRSCLNCQEIRSMMDGLKTVERVTYAQLKLTRARSILGDHDGMIDALNQICGEGKRPSELSSDRRANERATNFVNCGLTILAKHWGV